MLDTFVLSVLELKQTPRRRLDFSRLLSLPQLHTSDPLPWHRQNLVIHHSRTRFVARAPKHHFGAGCRYADRHACFASTRSKCNEYRSRLCSPELSLALRFTY